jgi:ABC-type Mn2+/Zn2+ transport system ATPase subunit
MAVVGMNGSGKTTMIKPTRENPETNQSGMSRSPSYLVR